MKMPKRAIAVALGVTAMLTAFGLTGCGDKAGGGPGASNDAVKYMGGPPPGAKKPGAPAGNAAAPPAQQGGAPGGSGR